MQKHNAKLTPLTLGNATLQGLGGNDTVYGGDGNDTLEGGAGKRWRTRQAANDETASAWRAAA